MNLLKRLPKLALIALIALPLALSSFDTEAKHKKGHKDVDKYVLISHAPDSDSWWNTIKNALKDAAKDYKVQVDYRNPPTGDLADMARLIEQAAAKNYKGIVTTIADYDVLKGAIGKVKKKGIPFVTINSGTQAQSRQLGAIMHVGQPEYDAGKGAGMKAKDAGIKSFLCVNHYMTNPASVERCQGFADALGVKLGGQMIDSGQDPTGIQQKVTAYLKKNPDTQAILTLGPTSAHPTLKALDKMKKSGKIYFGTFDLSGEIIKGLKSGVIKWAIDQQPYLQGYMPISVLVLRNRYGVQPGNNINSGPGFVTKDNIGLVEKFAGEYR